MIRYKNIQRIGLLELVFELQGLTSSKNLHFGNFIGIVLLKEGNLPSETGDSIEGKMNTLLSVWLAHGGAFHFSI